MTGILHMHNELLYNSLKTEDKKINQSYFTAVSHINFCKGQNVSTLKKKFPKITTLKIAGIVRQRGQGVAKKLLTRSNFWA